MSGSMKWGSSDGLSLAEKRRRLKKMEEFFSSDGWHILKDIIQSEATQVAMSIGDDPRVSAEVMHFERGLVRASKEFLSMDQRILYRMRSDVQIEEATKPASPAKAGRKD